MIKYCISFRHSRTVDHIEIQDDKYRTLCGLSTVSMMHHPLDLQKSKVIKEIANPERRSTPCEKCLKVFKENNDPTRAH